MDLRYSCDTHGELHRCAQRWAARTSLFARRFDFGPFGALIWSQRFKPTAAISADSQKGSRAGRLKLSRSTLVIIGCHRLRAWALNFLNEPRARDLVFEVTSLPMLLCMFRDVVLYMPSGASHPPFATRPPCDKDWAI
jgi:hypothetical protein